MSTLREIKGMRDFGHTDADDFQSIQIKNRRGPGLDPAEAELTRLSRRKAIKENLARLRLAAQRQSELQQQRRSLDAELDQLAASHEERLEGVQGALSVIEKRMIADISQGRSTNPEDEQQRKQLLEQIDQANISLQRSLKEVREKIPLAEKLLSDIRPEASLHQASQRDLTERNVANPELFKRYLVAQNRSDWAARRVKGLSVRMEDIQDQINQAERWQREQQGISYARELERLQSLADDVRSCLSDASAESSASASAAAAARQAIADE